MIGMFWEYFIFFLVDGMNNTHYCCMNIHSPIMIIVHFSFIAVFVTYDTTKYRIIALVCMTISTEVPFISMFPTIIGKYWPSWLNVEGVHALVVWQMVQLLKLSRLMIRIIRLVVVVYITNHNRCWVYCNCHYGMQHSCFGWCNEPSMDNNCHGWAWYGAQPAGVVWHWSQVLENPKKYDLDWKQNCNHLNGIHCKWWVYCL